MSQDTALKFRFDTSARRVALAAVVMVLASAYAALAVRRFVASWSANRGDLASLERSIRLDPGNADYHDRLGRFYEREARDPGSALTQYEASVQLDRHSSRYWLDLASAYRVLGDITNQTAAIEQAIHADPTTPDVAWEAANLYMAGGDDEKALREFGVVIGNDNSLAGEALRNCWRLKPDVDVLLRNVIPVGTDSYLGFLELLESKQETAGTVKVWNVLMQTQQSFEPRYSYDYIRYLIEHREADHAVMVWQQTASRFGLSSYLPSSSNLVVNGNFAVDVLNAGFDWQYQKQDGVTLTLDPTDFHGGRRSLLVTFDGPGISEAGIFQVVAVQPNTSYRFEAYYKNAEMEGAGGPHFAIQDLYTQTTYYESEELKDSGFWKSAEGEFTTGPDCKLVRLHIRRTPSGSPIRGKLWVDDFHLTRMPS